MPFRDGGLVLTADPVEILCKPGCKAAPLPLSLSGCHCRPGPWLIQFPSSLPITRAPASPGPGCRISVGNFPASGAQENREMVKRRKVSRPLNQVLPLAPWPGRAHPAVSCSSLESWTQGGSLPWWLEPGHWCQAFTGLNLSSGPETPPLVSDFTLK